MRSAALFFCLAALPACAATGLPIDDGTPSAITTSPPAPMCPDRIAAPPTSWRRVIIPGDPQGWPDPQPYHVRSDGTSVVLTSSGGILTTFDEGATFRAFGKALGFVALEESHGRFVAQPDVSQGAGPLYESLDQGVTWAALAASPAFNVYPALAVGSEDALFVETSFPELMKGTQHSTFVSRDRGASWGTLDAQLPYGLTQSWKQIDYWARTLFAESDTQLFVTGGTTDDAPEKPILLRSSDGGASFQSWTGTEVPAGCLIDGMWGSGQTFVLMINCSIAVTYQTATLWYSKDGGATFSPSQVPALPVLAQGNSMQFFLREVNGNARGDLLVSGDDGVLLYSRDGGASFTRLDAPTTEADLISSAWVTDCGAFYALAGNTGSLYIGH